MNTTRSQPTEIAAGVHVLRTGSGRFASNVYFLRSAVGWVLVDTGWPGSEQAIVAAAELLHGTGARPAAIVLTHIHPDHTGSLPELARRWGVGVHVHPAEVPQAQGKLLDEYANPLDRRVLRPVMRLLPSGAMQETDLSDVVRTFDPAAGVPGLPEWRCVPTPGHTPGHIALLREADGVLLAGDAVLTVDVNSPTGLVSGAQRVGGPPWITTWDRPAAEASIVALADLRPHVLAPGHGLPLTGPEATRLLSDFAAGLRRTGQGRHSPGSVARSTPGSPRPAPLTEYRRVSAARPYLALGGLVICYLALIEVTKRIFFRPRGETAVTRPVRVPQHPSKRIRRRATGFVLRQAAPARVPYLSRETPTEPSSLIDAGSSTPAPNSDPDPSGSS
ncbi:MBL fold metallo-hydrolase [Brevibacterium daeguense]|uniref:MBL fold metallo-hydrolase n=1 Tax=Brevibacterium daeguense TaxID=909936 RepID=UPI0031D593DC